MDEGKLRDSFQNIKRDINTLRLSIEEITHVLKNSKIKNSLDQNPKKEQDSSGKIFTSKVTLNEGMRQAVDEVFDSGIFSNGEKNREFEKKFAEHWGVKHAIAVSNGTVSIEIILRCLGIGPGDEVIVPSHTTMPTVEPVLSVGAKPIFADVEEESYNLDPKSVAKKITKKTKAIIAVHLYGNSVDIEKLAEICKKRKIHFIEDCAQSHGTMYKGKQAGSFGIASSFSFYPTKNLTVCGEGGMITTNDDALAKMARTISSHGEEGRYNHVILGGNYRLSEIHAAIGIKQLELLDKFVERRRELANIYDKEFKGFKGIILPKETKNSKHSYHLYVIRVNPKVRDKLIEKMKAENIFLGIHYPTPVHKQPVIKNSMKVGKLKVTEKISKEIVSLPMYPTLKDSEAKKVAERVKKVVKELS